MGLLRGLVIVGGVVLLIAFILTAMAVVLPNLFQPSSRVVFSTPPMHGLDGWNQPTMLQTQASWFRVFTTGGMLLLLLLAGVAVLVVFLRRGPRGIHPVQGEEARIMQEIYQGLSRLERRVEALETILLERPGTGRAIPEAFESRE